MEIANPGWETSLPVNADSTLYKLNHVHKFTWVYRRKK